MKTAIVVLAYVALASSSVARDKRSHSHTQAYPVPVSIHTVVHPSSTLPVYEYPESTQIDTHSRTVYSVSVPITHTVHLEQPSHSRQVIYHNPPANIPTHSYTPQAYTQQAYTPQVYTQQAYTPHAYTQQAYTQQAYTQHYPVHTPQVHRRVYTYTPSQPWVYRRYANTWC